LSRRKAEVCGLDQKPKAGIGEEECQSWAMGETNRDGTEG
jgi:hypothetical protein